MDEVLDFINRRWQKDCDWTNGNCYWFAHILTARFPNLEIFYLPISGHFVAGDGFSFYDWTGQVTLTEKAINWRQLEHDDNLWHGRLVRDCVR